MIIDTSVVIAVLTEESEAEHFTRLIAESPTPRMSAGSYLEAAIVIDANHNPVLSRRFDQWLAALEITVEPVTEQHAHLARQAYREFGRGSGHRARLNFGDCFAYALASATGDALLFTGDDFSATDLRAALAAGEPDVP